MSVIPSADSLRVLVAWSEALEKRRGWVELDPSVVPGLEGMNPTAVKSSVGELTGRGYCTPAAHGNLVYLTKEGAKLARAARELLHQGRSLANETLDSLSAGFARQPQER